MAIGNNYNYIKAQINEFVFVSVLVNTVFIPVITLHKQISLRYYEEKQISKRFV